MDGSKNAFEDSGGSCICIFTWFLLISFVDPVGFGPCTDSGLTSTKNKQAVSICIKPFLNLCVMSKLYF